MRTYRYVGAGLGPLVEGRVARKRPALAMFILLLALLSTSLGQAEENANSKRTSTSVLSVLSSSGSVSRLGDVEQADLFLKNLRWGNWGFGLGLVAPTISDPRLSGTKWQDTQAAAIVYSGIPSWQVGVVARPYLAGDLSHQAVNKEFLPPGLALTPKKAGLLGQSDVDWKRAGLGYIPVGLQLGKVLSIGNQHMSLSAEFGWTVLRMGGTRSPDWAGSMTIMLLFPE
jgi:hypothetical protein